ncbi:MAG: leucine-rich repeat domain-containing protein [Odoribacteraceae bacterium]|jgi:hypothetical protein|nr:leucine-rich repeat domain-containing protein [Odoribacteraceae bacterium]
MSSVATKLGAILESKEAIRQAINDKGVAVGAGVALREYAAKIGEIGGVIPSPPPEIPWTPPEEWWDIDTIFEEDVPPEGHEKRLIVLLSDANETTALSGLGGSYYRASDGYTGAGEEHAWDISLDKPCPGGYATRYVIIYTATGSRGVALALAGYQYSGVLRILVGDAHLTGVTLGSQDSTSSTCSLVSFRCSDATTVSYPETGGNMFPYCSSLREVMIPGGVTHLGARCMEGCHALSSVSLPSTLRVIRESCFKNCVSLHEINIPEGVTSIETSAFLACASLRRVSLPSTLVSMGGMAFQYCAGLVAIKLSPGLANIGTLVFTECKALVELDIPEGITTTAQVTFDECVSLRRVSFPSTLKTVGNISFLNCRSLVEVDLSMIDSAGSVNFNGCGALRKARMPKACTLLSTGRAFNENASLSEAEVPTGVTTVPSYSFLKCAALWRVDIPEGVVAISQDAFRQCATLQVVSLPTTLKTLGHGAFSYCNRLDGVILPPGLTSIADNAFYGCLSLSIIHLPPGITTLGNSAFRGCSALRSIFIPGSVTSIGNYVFNSCRSLEVLEIDPGWVPSNNLVMDSSPLLSKKSVLGLVANLGDNTGGTTRTIQVAARVLAMIPDEQKAILVEKNYTLIT